MNNSNRIMIKLLGWSAVIGFIVLSVLFGIQIRRLLTEVLRPSSTLWSGNSVTDPFAVILGIGAPIGLAGVLSLAFLWRSGLEKGSSVLTASFFFLICTTALFTFGMCIFRDHIPGYFLSDLVWWLKPFARVFGI